MIRRATASVLLPLGIAFLVSCTDERSPTGPVPVTSVSSQISDEARQGQFDFFWLPPTVSAAPVITGPFDASALDQLVVQVERRCEYCVAAQVT